MVGELSAKRTAVYISTNLCFFSRIYATPAVRNPGYSVPAPGCCRGRSHVTRPEMILHAWMHVRSIGHHSRVMDGQLDASGRPTN